MKKILLICTAAAALTLAACEQDPQEARDRATNADNAMGTPYIAASSGDPSAQAEQQQQQQQQQRTPEQAIVGGAMVNTPVPSDSPALQNTPAPTVAQATTEAGAAASTCGADQSWVGQDIKSIDLSKITGPVRRIQPGQPVTMDYSDQRLNIVVEPGTARVLEVKCG